MPTDVTARHPRAGSAPPTEFEHLREAVKQADWANATKMLTDLESRFPLDPEVWYWRATLAKSDHEAEGHLEQILSVDPSNTKALKALALMRLGASSRAMPAFQAAQSAVGPCLVCGYATRADSVTCGGCGCITDSTRLQEILNNREPDRAVTAAAIERRIKLGTADALFGAALGCLNIGQWSEAQEMAALAAAADPLHTAAAALATRLQSNRGWVLSAVASPAVRAAVMKVMDRAGYAVRTAADANEAMEHAGPPTRLAVVGDMPAWAGKDLCRQIRSLVPSLPVILVGGGWMDRFTRGSGAVEHLPASFDAAALAAAALPHLER